MLKRRSTAVWRGDAQGGKGALTTQSGAFQDQPYSFQTRFQSEDGRAGTNPEELLAAAHVGCFVMALSYALSTAGSPPEELRGTATVSLDAQGGNFTITAIQLDVQGKVPGLDAAKFQEIAEGAKKNCPLSKALAAVPISLNATLG